MASLSNPNLQIDILTGEPNVRVTGTVHVELSQFETFLVNAGLPLYLESSLWGNDGGLTGRNDHLFSLPTQQITAPGIYTFSAILPSETLNEDDGFGNRGDEVFKLFRMVSGTNLFPVNVEARSWDIKGYF
jgi:hypothetical protein